MFSKKALVIVAAMSIVGSIALLGLLYQTGSDEAKVAKAPITVGSPAPPPPAAEKSAPTAPTTTAQAEPPEKAPSSGPTAPSSSASSSPGGKRCPSAELAPFPWPNPPLPSVTALVPRHLLFEGYRQNSTMVGVTTLAEVAARLEGAIARAGYREPKYLGAGCKGFAIVLDLEHIEADGRRKGGTSGFAPPSQETAFNLTDFVKRLFYAPPGYYRQIVFVVSEERIANATPPPTEEQLRAIARDGVSALPSQFESLYLLPNHVILALIYEFRKGPRDGDVSVIPPKGRLGGTVHLMKAQLF